jgi:hypothetical protein
VIKRRIDIDYWLSKRDEDMIRNVFSLASISVMLVVSVMVAVCIHSILPVALNSSQDTIVSDESFPGLAAYAHLPFLCNASRVAGSQHNLDSYQYLYSEVEAIAQSSANRIELLTDRYTGSKPSPDYLSMLQYINSTQILAVLRGTSNSTVLLSAHFDSVSPGASDNGAAVTIALEIFRILSKR